MCMYVCVFEGGGAASAMKRGFPGIVSQLLQLKCLIHISCTKELKISRHLH